MSVKPYELSQARVVKGVVLGMIFSWILMAPGVSLEVKLVVGGLAVVMAVCYRIAVFERGMRRRIARLEQLIEDSGNKLDGIAAAVGAEEAS